jgi:polyferredoxin
MTEYTLTSWAMEVTYYEKPEHWQLLAVAWALLWMTITVLLLYGYAVLFANVVGFEAALLIGIGLLVIENNG